MSAAGRSAVVVPIAAAEPIVAHWRARHDPSAAQGMPAHVTTLYPFLAERLLDRDAVASLRAIAASFPATQIRFAELRRWPGVIYLAPEPAGGFVQLTEAIAARWPEAPPYGGAHDTIVPHLTVAMENTPALAAALERDIAPRLPFTASIDEARLYVFDGARWNIREHLPFGPA